VRFDDPCVGPPITYLDEAGLAAHSKGSFAKLMERNEKEKFFDPSKLEIEFLGKYEVLGDLTADVGAEEF
jgi:hypothetical protein